LVLDAAGGGHAGAAPYAVAPSSAYGTRRRNRDAASPSLLEHAADMKEPKVEVLQRLLELER
jgi:hypothetical protein